MTKQHMAIVYCIGIFVASWVSQLAGIRAVRGDLENGAITPWLIVAMITPALGVLLLMAFYRPVREQVLWKANWRAFTFAPYSVLIPTLDSCGMIAVFSWMGWGRSPWFEFSLLVYRCWPGAGYWGEELKVGSCFCAMILDYPEHPVLGAFILSPLLLVAASSFMAWLTLRTQSFWPAALAHGAGDSIQGGLMSSIKTSLPGLNLSLTELAFIFIVGVIFFILMIRQTAFPSKLRRATDIDLLGDVPS